MRSVPDSRNHRGAHPADEHDFASGALPRLRDAVLELSFLFGRAYAHEAALKLVGDHHQLTARQRLAVLRGACSDGAARARAERRLSPEQLAGRSVSIDGFNCLISIEAMLSAAPLFRGRDGALRDLASVHGTYRKVAETERAAQLMLATLAQHGVAQGEILLDRPVRNSGRTRALLQRCAAQLGGRFEVLLSDHVDRELAARTDVVASSDAWILDRVSAWIDLPALVVQHAALAPWLVELG